MYQSDVSPLRRVLMKHARDAFVAPGRIAEQWKDLNYSGPPVYEEACRESDALAIQLEDLGVTVEWAEGRDLGLDSIYMRDPSVVTDAGAVLCRMGKESRAVEPAAHANEYARLEIRVAGMIESPGTLEGGDAVWLDRATLAVGCGKRTNHQGVLQLQRILTGTVEVLEVPLPDWSGLGDVFHLMSVVSPVAEDLLLVYPPLLPVCFHRELLERGYQLIEVPHEEYEPSMGCNVLTITPGVVLAVEGNSETRRRLEAVGVEVHTYLGTEISRKGFGGPTCLTRTLERESD